MPPHYHIIILHTINFPPVKTAICSKASDISTRLCLAPAMRRSTFVMSALGLATVISLGGNVAQYRMFTKLQDDTMQERQPNTMAHSLEDFRTQAYGAPDRWLWHPEARGIGRMRSAFSPVVQPAFSDTLAGLRKGKGTQAATLDILKWYLANRQAVALAHMATEASTRKLFCDEETSIFRSLLTRAAIQSRVVNFQFTDGDGGASHTALEVWLPQEGRWIYVDPHYGAYSDTDMLTTARNFTRLTILEPANTAILHQTFTEGMALIAIETHTPRQRIYTQIK